MGMDVYGVNPTIRVNTTKPERPDNLHTGASEEVIKKYFDQEQEYEDQNPGVYFRNNVWWWRPLADFIIDNSEWLTQEQKSRLHDNSGFEFSHHEAVTIADTLQKKLDDGTAQTKEDTIRKEMKEAEEWNDKLDKQMEALGKIAIKETGDAKLVPRDYPKHIKDKWDKLLDQQDRRASYPFSVKNIKEFIRFLRESGGFQVC